MAEGGGPASIGSWLFGRDRSIGFGLENLGKLTLTFPRVMAVFVIAMTAFCFAQLPRASVDGDLLRVYAHSGPDYDAYRELADTFGTFENDIYLLIRSPNLTDPATIEEIRTLALSVTLSDYLSGSMSAFTLRKPGPDGGTLPVVPEGMTSPGEVRAALTDLQQNDPLMRNLINPDLSGVVIILFPNHDIVSEQGTKPMLDDLRKCNIAITGLGDNLQGGVGFDGLPQSIADDRMIIRHHYMNFIVHYRHFCVRRLART